MTQAPSTLFNPSPEEADRLLSLYLDPSLSLADLAREAGTTLLQFQRWLSLPETAAQLDHLEQAAAQRTRHLAGQHLPEAVGVLTTILRDHLQAHKQGDLSADPETRRRQDETARRAANLLIRLSRWTAGPARARTSSTNAPAAPQQPPQHTQRPQGAPDPVLLARLLALAAPAADPAADPPTQPTPHPAAPEPPPAPPAHNCATPDAGDAPAAAASESNPGPLEPETLAALERLATIPDDCPKEEMDRLIATVLASPRLPALLLAAPLREAG